jgi:hypothetical protein
MSDKYNNVFNDNIPKSDIEFFTVLGWLSALSVSIASWAFNA